LEAGEVYRILAENCHKKWPFGRLRKRSEDKIKVDLKEIHCEMGGEWNGHRIMSIGRHVESQGSENWLFHFDLIFLILVSDKNSN
jgi:hypothetical protein